MGPFLSLWLPGGAQALGEGGRRGKIEVEDESKNADQLEGSGWAQRRLSIGRCFGLGLGEGRHLYGAKKRPRKRPRRNRNPQVPSSHPGGRSPLPSCS